MSDFDKPPTSWTRRTLKTGRIAASLGRRAASAAVRRRLARDGRPHPDRRVAGKQ